MSRPDPLEYLLDEVQPPPAPEEFAARIAATATAQPQAAPGRDGRGAWAWRHRTSATFIAAALLLASAMAAAIVGGKGLERLRGLPLIAPETERIAPHSHPAAKLAEHRYDATVRSAAPEFSAPEPTASSSSSPQAPNRQQQAAGSAVEARTLAGVALHPQHGAVEHRTAGEPASAVHGATRVHASRTRSPDRKDTTDLPGPEQAPSMPPAPDWQNAPSFPSYEEWRAVRREWMRRYRQTMSPAERRQFREEKQSELDLEPPPPRR